MVCQLDAILTHLGTGRWTILYFITAGSLSFFLAPQTLGGAFLAPRLDYSCHVPSSSISSSSSATLATNHQENFTAVASESKCEYWIDSPDGERIVACTEFDFDNSTFSSTFTSEFNLACDRSYLQTTFQSIYMLGIFIGAPVNGYLADKYGRRLLLVVGIFIYLLISVTSAWLPVLSTILLARFILGVFHAICCFTSYVLMVEIMEPTRRPAAGFSVYVFWALAMIVYGGFGYLIRDWRILQTVVALPGLIILPALWMIDESPRWLIVNGRPKEALKVLTKVARWHGVDLPPQAEMKVLLEEQTPKAPKESEPLSLRRVLKPIIDEVVILFRTPRLRTITLCVFLDYLMAGMVYFGLSLSGASISDNPYVYMALSGLMEIPAYTLTIPVVQHFGRKCTLSTLFLISAVVLFTLAIIPAEYSVTVMILAMVGKIATTGGFQTIIFFSSELFPTEVRSRGVGASFMMSRVGSMVSPYITDLVGTVYPWAPFAVFGTGALLAGAGTFLLPETRGQILHDTVAQLEDKSTKTLRKPSKLIRLFQTRVDSLTPDVKA